MAQKSDGQITFDTSIDNSGIEKGVKQMASSVNDFAQTAKKDFSKVDDSVNSTAKNAEKLEEAFKVSSEPVEKMIKQLDNLNSQIETQQKILDQLREKYERLAMVKGFDDTEVLKLRQQILKTEESMDKMIDKSDKLAKELRELEEADSQAADSVEDLSQEASKTGKDLEKMGDSANKAEKEVKDLKEEAGGGKNAFTEVSGALQGLSGTMDTLGIKGSSLVGKLGDVTGKLGEASASSGAFAAVVTGVTIAAVVALAVAIEKLMDSTEEMRDGYAKLEANAESVGVSMDTVRTSMESLNEISPDFNANLETTSNLLQAGFTESNMGTIIERLSDAVIAFPDTLKFETLAESLQETIATKEATGQFAELLGRLGVNVEQFNEGLKRAAESGKEQDYVLKTLYQSSLPGLSQAYKENNKDIIEARQANYALKEAFAELAKEISPAYNAVKNFFTNALTGLIQMLTEAVKGVKDLIKSFSELGSKPLKLPAPTYTGGATGYALGTPSATPGWHLVGEEGAELVYFGGGEKVLPAAKTRRFLSEPAGLVNRSDPTEYASYTAKAAEIAKQTAGAAGSAVNYAVKNVQNVANKYIHNEFKVDDIATYMRIMERMEYEQQSERMGWTGGF